MSHIVQKNALYNATLFLSRGYKIRWSMMAQMDRKKGALTFHPSGTFLYACVAKKIYVCYSTLYDLSNSTIFKDFRRPITEIHGTEIDHSTYVRKSMIYVRIEISLSPQRNWPQ